MNLIPDFYLYSNNWINIKIDSFNYFLCGWTDYKGNIFKGSELAKLVCKNELVSYESIAKFVNDLNGNFTIIISYNECTYILSDRMRMFPIIYFIYNKKLILTDNLDRLCKEQLFSFEFNDVTLEQYFFSDYVFGPFTIFKDVYSSQSGEIVKISHSNFSFTRRQYFKWEPNMQDDNFNRNFLQEARQQDVIFQSVFQRMLNSATNVNNWIIPLSGGYDSRTIVNYLYKLGVKNIICFSYGIENNIQSHISKQVADALGYKWYFIDYKSWIKKISTTNLINDFIKYAFNGTSVAHLQDFIAVYALKEMGVLQIGDVFVPGHALEVLAGNHLDHKMKFCKDSLSALSIIRKHFSNFDYSDRKRVTVSNHVKELINNYGVNPEQMAEYFDWQERQTKYIAYSVKVYDYFGYDWRIPEWDLELFKYWKTIGFNYRINRNMYKNIFKEYLRIELLKDIPFANDILEQKRKLRPINLRDYLPLDVKRIIKKFLCNKSQYYVDEGLHLVYSNHTETIGEYMNSFDIPKCIKKHLLRYPKRQKLSTLPINSVTTLLNIRYFQKN